MDQGPRQQPLGDPSLNCKSPQASGLRSQSLQGRDKLSQSTLSRLLTCSVQEHDKWLFYITKSGVIANQNSTSKCALCMPIFPFRISLVGKASACQQGHCFPAGGLTRSNQSATIMVGL
jgi:hypothetical protein